MAHADRLDAGEIRRLEFDVDFPPGHAAAYLVPGDEPFLVDAGTLGSSGTDDLEAGLAEFGCEPAVIEHVLLTHPHVDHVGQMAHLREVADPTIHAATPVRSYLERDPVAMADASRATLRQAGVDEEIIAELVPEFEKSETIIRDVLPVDAVDHWIEPGEPATVGPLRVDPIHTPGHHEPHVCYATRLDGERALFSGDMLIEPFRAITIHAGLAEGVEEGLPAFRRALDRLADESVDRVFPGHGPIHERPAATIERSRADIDERLATCGEKLREGGSTALHVAANLSRDDRDIARLVPEVISALATLETQGRATSSIEDGVRYYEPV